MDRSTLKISLAALAIAAGVGMAEARGNGPHDENWTFDALDADGSGEITLEDLETVRMSKFSELDGDGDGSITLDEFTAHAEARAAGHASEMFERMDADGDGVLGMDAFASRMRGGPGERLLSRFDADNSGGISAEEFEVAKQRMAERRGEMRGGGKHGWGRWHN